MKITQDDLDKLIKKLEYLKTTKRREIALRIKTAKEFGDLSENAEYSEAKDAQALNGAQIAELDAQVKSAEIIKTSGKSTVQIGSKIKVSSENGIQKFEIVSSNDSDPINNKISDQSPIGQALLGHSLGDKVEVKLLDLPAGGHGKKVHYKILEIK